MKSTETFPVMQLACSSMMLDDLLVRGGLTQLEWVDLAARSLPVQGLVFDMRHFPRTDSEYLAELRKLCVDRALTIAALSVEHFFAHEAEGLEAIFTIAELLGTVIIMTDPPLVHSDVPMHTWREAIHRGKLAARMAKKRNITIALRNCAHTACPTAADLKHFTKDIDSSWIRFAPEVSSLSAEDLIMLRTRSIILSTRALHSYTLEPDRKGFFVLEATEPKLDAASLVATVRAYAVQLRSI